MPLEYEEGHVFEVVHIFPEMDVFPNDVDQESVLDKFLKQV